MINFLADPKDFKLSNIRTASTDDLRAIAIVQYKRANTLKLASNWLTNIISSGLAKVKNFFKYIRDGFLKILKTIMVRTPVIKVFTKFWQEVAYNKLLNKMFTVYEKGREDKIGGMVPLGRLQFIRFMGSRDGLVFYGDYIGSYEGTTTLRDLRVKAIKIVEKDIGLRTISEMMKTLWESINFIKAIWIVIYEGTNLSKHGKHEWSDKGIKKLRSLRKRLRDPNLSDRERVEIEEKIAKVKKEKSSSKYPLDKMVLFALNLIIPFILLSSFPLVSNLLIFKTLTLGSLLYNNPKEVLVGDSAAVKKLRKSVKRVFKQQKDLAWEDIYEGIPTRDVFVLTSEGDLESVANASKEEIDELIKGIK